MGNLPGRLAASASSGTPKRRSFFSNGSRARLRDISNGIALITVPKAVREKQSARTPPSTARKTAGQLLSSTSQSASMYRTDTGRTIAVQPSGPPELASRHDTIVTRTNASSELDSLGVSESKSLPGWCGDQNNASLSSGYRREGCIRVGRMLLMLRFLGVQVAAAIPCQKARHPRESALRW